MQHPRILETISKFRFFSKDHFPLGNGSCIVDSTGFSCAPQIWRESTRVGLVRTSEASVVQGFDIQFGYVCMGHWAQKQPYLGSHDVLSDSL